MTRSIKVTVMICRLVQYFYILVGRGSPINKAQERARVRLQNAFVLIDTLVDRRTYGEDDASRVVTSCAQHVMKKPTVYTPVTILERMNIHEAEGKSGGGRNGVNFVDLRPVRVGDEPAH